MPGQNATFTTRTNGLEVYVQTYLAVAKALKAVVPLAAFGPSNMAGISGGANGGVSDAQDSDTRHIPSLLRGYCFIA